MRRKLALALGFTLVTHAAVAQMNERKALAFAAIDRNADQIATIGDTVYYFGELGMQEIESAKFVKGVLESIGFTVETGTAGMNTNIWAHWGTGKPQVVIVSEIDALPGGSQAPLSIDHKPLVAGAPGHMEGHNTHAGVAIGAAYAVKQAMQRFNIPGSVVISFGPAEEQIVSRPYLVRAGLYKDADVAILLHIGDGFAAGYGLMNYAAISAKFDFHGKTAHGAVDPWNGKDAVDAVELMDIGFDKLREHLHPTYRAHRAITAGGIQPNIIADHGQIWWFVRDADMASAKETFDKLVKIAEGAALMTGTPMEYKIDAAAWPQLGVKPLAEVLQANIETIGMPQWSEEEQAFARKFQTAMGARPIGLRTAPTPLGQRTQSASSNDNGDVTWVVPSAALNFPGSVPGIGYHNWQAAVTPTSTIAHKGMVAGAKVLAGTIIDLLSRPELVAAARAEFDKQTSELKYFAVLPADAKPPLDLNKETMDRYRPAMRQFYLDKPVRFE
ncbi:MAG: amidohydrolase [Xanthobacteraceae bacterium]|nr:amidohydrolase [Xanthobacteraceae bacterium]